MKATVVIAGAVDLDRRNLVAHRQIPNDAGWADQVVLKGGRKEDGLDGAARLA